MKESFLADLQGSLPAGAALGTLLAAFQPDFYLNGWLAFVFLSVLGVWLLTALWRWAGGGRALMAIMLAAFLVRLAGGVALSTLLPIYGYDQEQQRAGYVFYDASRRDSEAWSLARSTDPLWAAIGSEKYASDQYGGLLMLSAGIYRAISYDVHRPMLIILLAALAGALVIPFAKRALAELFDEKIALSAAWILALYPESVLLGGSQMREPFLIAFLGIILWGFALRETHHTRPAWGWMIFGIFGLLIFSPGIALAVIAVFGIWHFVGGTLRRTSWLVFAATGLVIVLGAIFLASIVARTTQEVHGSGPFAIIFAWLSLSARWDFYILEQTSGIVQFLMEVLPAQLQIPFLVGYGVTQPLLPAVLIEPAALIWKLTGILRSAGWYLLLPFLVYGLFATAKVRDAHQKRILVWLEIFIWGWILFVSARGGADQWDNPRYRTIMLPFMALIAAWVWSLWREQRDRWLGRILAAEAVFVLTFLAWYCGRYYGFPKASILFYLVIAAIAIVLVFAGDFVYEKYVKIRKLT